MDSCLISAFMLWPMCLAQTTWKPRGWLHDGGTKVHLRWTLWPTSSGVITGRDGRAGTAAGDKVKTVRLALALGLLVQNFKCVVFGELSFAIYFFLTFLETKQTLLL